MRELTGVQYQCYEQKDSHLIVASKSGRWVGSTEWRKDDGEVMGIGVEKRYRRRGVATTMWTMAHDCGPDPRHSSRMSKDARLWAACLRSFAIEP